MGFPLYASVKIIQTGRNKDISGNNLWRRVLRATESPTLNFVCDSPHDPHFVQSSELLVLRSAVNPAHFDVSGPLIHE
jgi:hypothetical protein